jgi:hypothetical protein
MLRTELSYFQNTIEQLDLLAQKCNIMSLQGLFCMCHTKSLYLVSFSFVNFSKTM